VPRHREIDFRLARTICADLDPAADGIAISAHLEIRRE